MSNYVYVGKLNNKIVYVGTTIQPPNDRFRWHKANGKDLDFSIYKKCDTPNEMLDLEFELITKYNPTLNKIKHRKQNFNAKLKDDVLRDRIGNKEWCQCCLKRRVNKEYEFCYWCTKE
jgi:hypothetical protein